MSIDYGTMNMTNERDHYADRRPGEDAGSAALGASEHAGMQNVFLADTTNTQINWLVAKIEGELDSWEDRLTSADSPCFYTEDPSQSWPIIDREKIDIEHSNSLPSLVYAKKLGDEPYGSTRQSGPTSLVAAMRCHIFTRMGSWVQVPKNLESI